MKILLLHSDFIEFEPKQKAIKQAEEAGSKQRIEECLVVLIAVEEKDEANTLQATSNLITEIKKVASEVKAENIVLYPYAHLSKDLSSPDTALNVLKEAEKILKKDFSVTRAPFGWYKKFHVSVKGHPLAELSRDIGAEEVSEALKKEDALKFVTPELTEASKWDDLYSLYMAECYSIINEPEQALFWLENTIHYGIINYPFLNEYDPFLENIRGEERFKKLMERVKYEWENFEV